MRNTIALCAALTLTSGTAFAQQLLVFDETYTATAAGAFHHTAKMVAPLPANWVSPVDYSKGTAYIHHIVLDKPSKRPTTMTICFDGDLEGYGCITSKAYTDAGVHETVVPMTKTWQYNKIAWTKKRTEFHLVVKDPALGGTPGGRPASDFVPSRMRLVLSIVPPGGTYVRPAGLPAPDGALPPADAGASDAAPSTDAGTGGSGGAGGSGGGSPSASGGSGGSATPAPPAPTTPPAAGTPPASPAPTAPPATKPPANAPAPEAATASNSGGGCSVIPGGCVGTCALPLLALAAVAALLVRRRRRRG